MPVEFLSDEQAEAYGTFAEEPTRPEPERFFFLDDVDRDLIALRRTEHHRLGFALQMCTVRYVGLFLEDPLAVPWPVIEHLAVQLGIEDPSVVERYTERRQTVCKRRNEVERTINRLKNSRAVATRYDKRAFVFHGTITIAAIRLWLRP
ncbi:DUF4158 domain-containing protein [Streptomyces venezuelae]|uniref:DUF4158 domain-containing protein n=1 Tax=Streptomyces venezuelae TaxID=54571 RepID=A0A5P2ALD6_STRVZ|nr:hypothetical protein DEJ46_07760 [Streptomyces venezuelae]